MDLNRIVREALATDKIITPTLNDWLMLHGDEAVPKEIADKVYTQMTTPPRNRSASFSSSSAGQCHRRQVLAYLGIETLDSIDPRLQNIFNDGKWRHLRWQTMLLQAGLLDEMESPQVWKKMRSRGTLDGVGTVSDDHPKRHWRGVEYGFELKGVGSYVFPKVMKNEQVKEEHQRQVARYFLMTGYELFVIIYENKGTNEWFEWVVEPEDHYIQEQLSELGVLNDAVDTKTLPPMLKQCQARTGPTWSSCPYGGSHAAPCPRSGDWPNLKKRK